MEIHTISDVMAVLVPLAVVALLVWAVRRVWARTQRRAIAEETRDTGAAAHRDGLETRVAVLERIVTDPAERTARDIEALRN